MDDLVPSGPVTERSLRAFQPVWVLASLAALGTAFVMLVVTLYWPRTTVVEVFPQPAEVAYADGVSHVVVLTRVRAPVAAVPVLGAAAADRHQYVLGRDPSGGYGHLVRLEATGMDPRQLTVEWTAEGVWLDYPTGHRLFVPAESFTGGR